MRVCHIVPSLEERHGGPSRSVRALANAGAALGESVELLATLEAGQTVAGGEDLATVRTFPRVAPRWLSRSPEMRRYLQDTPADIVHHHSLWLLPLRYAGEAARRQSVPLVISPRGMMSGWAYRHRRGRKRLAEWLVHPGAFAAAAGWHATSPEERADIQALGFKQPVCVSPNGVSLPGEAELAAARAAWHQLCPATRARPVALFYSRLHRKKRVRELIDLWLAASRGDWLLLVVGVAEDYTPAELAANVAAAGAQDRVAVFDGAGRPPPYAAASLFVLPSHSENFGLVIAEALAAGVPALVTDTTPWTGLAKSGCGWCTPWENYGTALTAALATPAAELTAMGRRGRDWTAREFSWARAAGLLNEFYRHLRHERR
ncbi:glycosyltransferase [Opitutus sp. GAS368]|uniref:glycosyltransferase n=1 Tax=Opitutus sp. GAS368 TaxID=1882749 RepID=UPI00087C5444|nr:glycosyltransferase [Opitutus sp. GAS368]SDS64361.1 Glycosyltransferase involved in cell wall bisynthesis [Opitutus sp. GAS368]